jgi:hypothetical protein
MQHGQIRRKAYRRVEDLYRKSVEEVFALTVIGLTLTLRGRSTGTLTAYADSIDAARFVRRGGTGRLLSLPFLLTLASARHIVPRIQQGAFLRRNKTLNVFHPARLARTLIDPPFRTNGGQIKKLGCQQATYSLRHGASGHTRTERPHRRVVQFIFADVLHRRHVRR